ncbi:hypothetical protein CVT26_003099, partial [Gymnopilus dilepis]
LYILALAQPLLPSLCKSESGADLFLSFQQPHLHLPHIEEQVGDQGCHHHCFYLAALFTQVDEQNMWWRLYAFPAHALLLVPGTTSLTSKSEWEVAPLLMALLHLHSFNLSPS